MKMIKVKLNHFSFIICLFATLIPNVYAVPEEEQVNLLDFPAKLADALGIPEFAGQILASCIVLFMFLLPIAVFSKRNTSILSLIVGFTVMGFLVAVGWLPYWILLMTVLIVGALYSGKIKEWIT